MSTSNSGAPVRIGLIWAQSDGGVIGADGVMPWHVPEDLAHFKEITLGSPVVMGRKTWESLPPRFRPLPGRANIVITRSPEWSADAGDEVLIVHSVESALAVAAASITASTTHEQIDDQWIWVIGGAEIFGAVMAKADRLEVTKLNASFTGDTFAPAIEANWRIVASDPAEGWLASRGGLEYRFLRYER